MDSITVESLGFDRALIVQRHWCDLILRNLKEWEMRSSKTKFRGIFGVIEAGSGSIIGKTTLIDSLEEISEAAYFSYTHKHKISSTDHTAKNWKYPWVIKNSIRFEEPIPYIHPQGAVRWVRLTNDMLNIG